MGTRWILVAAGMIFAGMDASETGRGESKPKGADKVRAKEGEKGMRWNYPEQQDLFVGKSLLGDMWTAAHSGGSFCSQRFSRFGELFCYVKTDGSVDLSAEKFTDKAAIEDALDAALKASGTGAVVGGGTGLRYSYVDLALTDPDKGIHEVVDVLRKGNMVKRTWILFFDDIYRSEWVGVRDDSPAPPGME